MAEEEIKIVHVMKHAEVSNEILSVEDVVVTNETLVLDKVEE